MKKNILSLILGTTLALPTLAMAMPTNSSDSMQSRMPSSSVKSNVQVGVEGPTGKLGAAQSSQVNINNSSNKMNDSRSEMNDKSGTMSNSNMPTMNGNMPATTGAASSQSTQRTQTPNMQHSNSNYQPLIAGEAASNNKTANATSTLQEKKKDRRGELLATQPGQVEFNENRRFTIR
ncbi:hypothetical protein [Psychrobacter pocilloporae]|uniref:Uncharacterized protein n=1 Tax=Psychrobacter pocilloporae TaxID=1775882 RepID=A0ABT6IPM2_9GAMM|nr:hypothetical protein [Psychrobacter pocilloporae]MDH4903778.1 hypothetical protein [Psychrobacter pocilloporae]